MIIQTYMLLKLLSKVCIWFFFLSSYSVIFFIKLILRWALWPTDRPLEYSAEHFIVMNTRYVILREMDFFLVVFVVVFFLHDKN